MVGAKAAAKRAAKEAQAGSSDKAANGGGKSGKKGQPKQRARDEIVPWGWEQAAKDERKAKNVAKTQAEQAAKLAKEMADLGLEQKPVKKQPETGAVAAVAIEAKAGDVKPAVKGPAKK